MHEILSSRLLKFPTPDVDNILHFCEEDHQQWFYHFQTNIIQNTLFCQYPTALLLRRPSALISCIADMQLVKA